MENLKMAEKSKSEWCEDVERLQAENLRLREALETLARLGNGFRYGNSEGNLIAQSALGIDRLEEGNF